MIVTDELQPSDEWQTDSDGRRFRYDGRCIEYEARITCKEAIRPLRPPTKNRVMRAMRVGNLPLQGTREAVRMAISHSRGLSMMRQPVTPQALQPTDIHMVHIILR